MKKTIFLFVLVLLWVHSALAQTSVTGRVTDESTGEPLPFVTVVVKGTQTNALTADDGTFAITVPKVGSVLQFSSMGYETAEATVSGGQPLAVALRPAATTLKEVVITGIFTKSRESYTGAVSSMSEKELKMFQGQNLLTTLGNIDPSINIRPNNMFGSDPNRIPDLSIRGNSSLPTSIDELNNQAAQQLNVPLVIVDGFEISLQKLMDFNDEEIQDINLLKDASATAIYGSRGANGVIVITTKAPRPGRLRVYVQSSLQLEMPDLSSYNLLNAGEKLELERQVGLYDNKNDLERDRRLKQLYNERYAEVQRGVDTYWLSQPVRVGVGQRYNMRLDGGSNEFRWSAGLSYNNVQGAMKGSGREVFNGALTLSYEWKNVLFKNQVGIDFGKGDNGTYGAFSTYAAMNPYLRIHDAGGALVNSYTSLDGSTADVGNPLYDAGLSVVDQNRYNTIYDNFSIEWGLTEDLKLRGQIGLLRQENTSDYYLPADHSYFKSAVYLADENFFRKGRYTYGAGEEVNIDGNITLSYSKLFAEKHQLFAAFDYSVSHRSTTFYTFVAEGYSNEDAHFIANAMQYEQYGKPDGLESISRRIGFTGNVNYTFDNRYFIDLSLRADGSSQFGAKNRFAPFWSAGIGWNMHQEAFLKNQNIISRLRLRGSYGQTGSQQFEAYQALSTFRYYTDKRYMIWNGAELMGLGNENLKWQITDQLNGGFEAGLFNNRLSASFDIYTKKTSNLLSVMDIPLANGFPSYTDNVGEVKNTGFEAMLSGYLLRNTGNNLLWTVTSKLAYNKNTITKLSQAIKDQTELYKLQDADQNRLLYEGHSQYAIYAVPSLGIDPSTGQELYLDKDGNYTTTWHPSAKQYFGIAEPLYRGTISTMVSYKNLSLNLSFAGYWGGQQYNSTLLNKVEVSNAQIAAGNVDRRAYIDRWQKPGDVKPYKGYGSETTRATSRFVMDENVFQFQSASLQYRWNDAFVREKLHFETINFNLNMFDIFYISSIKQERGIDYPFARRLSLAISLLF